MGTVHVLTVTRPFDRLAVAPFPPVSPDSQKLSSIAAVAFVVLAGIWAWWWIAMAPPPAKSPGERDIIPPSLAAPASAEAPGARAMANYAAPGASDLDDMRLLARCAAVFLNELGPTMPLSLKDNQEWGQALRGELKGTTRWLADGPPVFSNEGKLVDRHGTPVRCVAVGDKAWEFRSAGPDKVLFTGDDAVGAVGHSNE